MKQFDFLRKKYQKVFYKRYSWRWKRGNLEISFHFAVPPDIVFHPKVLIKNVSQKDVTRIGKGVLNNLIFHLGMIEIPSYWKATCSPEIVVEAGFLNSEQITWWKNLIIKGLGQFFYENKIDWRKPDFLKISVNPSIAAPALNISALKLKNSYLIPIGGGKDSVVTLNLLKERGKKINCFLLNPTKAAQKVVKIASVKSPIIVERSIDPELLSLNRRGYLNGHTPFTAVLSFLSVFCAVLFDYKNIAFSNEKSANEGNVLYLGETINHQWAKTSEFEKMFRDYCQKYLAKNVNYFSFLRPYGELQIAKMFAKYPKYFTVFSSCNRGIKTGRRWCNTCPKCLSTYLMLSPYLEKKQLLRIFGKDLLEDKKLLPLLKSLTGKGKHKPFECVGTYQESRLALKLNAAKRIKK